MGTFGYGKKAVFLLSISQQNMVPSIFVALPAKAFHQFSNGPAVSSFYISAAGGPASGVSISPVIPGRSNLPTIF